MRKLAFIYYYLMCFCSVTYLEIKDKGKEADTEKVSEKKNSLFYSEK